MKLYPNDPHKYRTLDVYGPILNSQDVENFLHDLYIEGIFIHPDSDFHDIAAITDLAPETKDELNEMMKECHRVCEEEGQDIYEMAEEIRIDFDEEYLE